MVATEIKLTEKQPISNVFFNQFITCYSEQGGSGIRGGVSGASVWAVRAGLRSSCFASDGERKSGVHQD